MTSKTYSTLLDFMSAQFLVRPPDEGMESSLDYDFVYPTIDDCDSNQVINPNHSHSSEGHATGDGIAEIDNHSDGESEKRPKLPITHAESDTPESPRREHKIFEEKRDFEGSQSYSAPGFPNVLTAYKTGLKREHVRCVLTRHRSNLTYDTYDLRLEGTNDCLLIARRMSMSRTSNYHFFDMTRGDSTKNLSKNSGNYIGKLKALNTAKTEYILVNEKSEHEELAGFVYEHPDMWDRTDDAGRPRQIFVILPLLTKNGFPVINHVPQHNRSCSLTEILRTADPEKLAFAHTFGTKEPALVKGNFRLNFHGRVTVPSVKNFQLISQEDDENIILQFGKISSNGYNLDFKAPFNMLQAFAVALSQFNS